MDKLILALVAMLACAGAWFFLYEAQPEGFNILALVAIIVALEGQLPFKKNYSISCRLTYNASHDR